ncbi:MAG: hypothetical protein VX075_07500 [Pseudomonadota bacterium]|nr:hypothetical protein [Pseudomonadota bacterium]
MRRHGLSLSVRSLARAFVLWLKAGGKPVLHIVRRDKIEATDVGLIDHVACRATGYAGINAKLTERQVEYQEQCLPEIGLHQIFAKCEDGTWVQLIFDPAAITAD